MTASTLDFTSTDYTTTIPVKIPIGGEVHEYTMVLLSGAGSTVYENYRTNAIKFDKEGKPSGFENLAEMAPLLVSLCLTRPDGQVVTVEEVKTFPAKVLKALHETAKDINDLGKTTGMTEMVSKVFAMEGCPFSIEDIRKWLESLENTKEVEAVRELFELTEEDKSKNS